MIRGTTPTLEFQLPMSVETIADAYVTFAQKGQVLIDKKLADCSCGTDTLTVQLTQEDTLKLEAGQVTELQIRVKTKDNNALASQIMKVSTDRILKDGVI
jgi:hypothetical protein